MPAGEMGFEDDAVWGEALAKKNRHRGLRSLPELRTGVR